MTIYVLLGTVLVASLLDRIIQAAFLGLAPLFRCWRQLFLFGFRRARRRFFFFFLGGGHPG